MLRRLIVYALLGALFVAVATDAPAARKRVPSRAASVKVIDCQGGDGESRSATFQGRVRALRGSSRMGMRFTLLERFGDERLHAVAVPGLRSWHLSKPGIREYRYKQTVTELQGGGNYRARVDYRWYDADGDVVRRARRVSRICHQPGDLANLRPRPATWSSGPEGTAIYRVPVQNRGRAGAKDVAVELSVDGAAANVGHIDEIGPRETDVVTITGPVCKGGIRIDVDPSDSVKERRERDNVLKMGCPPRTP